MLTENKKRSAVEKNNHAVAELNQYNGELKFLTFPLAVVASVAMAGAVVVSGAGASNQGMVAYAAEESSKPSASSTAASSTAATAVTTTATPAATTTTTTALATTSASMSTTTTTTTSTTTTTATTTAIDFTSTVAETPLTESPTTVVIEVSYEEFGFNTLTLEIPAVEELPEEVEELLDDVSQDEEEFVDESFLEEESLEEDYSQDEGEYFEDDYLNDDTEEFVKEVEEEPQDYSYGVTDAEYILLCNCVAHEAGSDWIAEANKAAVVEVILNRVESSEFPSTIYGVITQRGQFEGCWNYADATNYTSKVSQSVKNAVSDYLDGNYSNHGYLYFYGDGRQNHFH